MQLFEREFLSVHLAEVPVNSWQVLAVEGRMDRFRSGLYMTLLIF
jgi:hypothetical protein